MADAAPKTQIRSPSHDQHENPSKLFLYKAALVTVFLVLVPLFPSLAPDFFNQNLHARSWELLQLIFVGIAVSYGLFSKKNDEAEKDSNNAQSYVSKLLQVSSVFDDESESESHAVIEESKFQALNSQYYRGEPVVVVAKENPAIEETNGVVSQISQKPLLLPVRSLKQRLPSPNHADDDDDDDRISSKRFTSSSSSSRKSRINGRLNVADKVEEKEEEKVVLRSPIPWRSRSGRMEMKETSDPPLVEEQELNSESRSFRSFRPNPNIVSSPKKNLSPSTSFSSKSGEEVVVRKKKFAPPPPAPPPPPFPRKSVLMKSSSSVGSTRKALERSVRSVPTEEMSQTEMDELKRFGVDNDELVEKQSMNKFLEKKNELAEKVVMDDTTDEEEDEFDEDNFAGNNVEAPADVDKKADEFIAKFREQIRLQRIESIRRSTAQRAGKSST